MPTPHLSPEQFQKYYAQLNPEQQAAVDAIEGPVMTIAGAGTGKTQILAVRIAKILLDTQIDPYNILCLTFTEAGVTAMRKRLMDIIGPAAYHIKIATFHSFCNEIIQENSEEFNFGLNHDQIDDLEKVLLLQEIIDELGVHSPLRPYGEPYHYQRNIGDCIKHLKTENIPPASFQQTLTELDEFLQKLLPLIDDFCNSKGRPEESQVNAIAPDRILPHFPEPSPIQQTYLNYYQKLYSHYQGNLDGSKKNDGPQRTTLRNNLREFIDKVKKQLPKQKDLAKAYQLYQEKLQTNKRYDYEDMIMLVSQKFARDHQTDDGGLLRKYQERYQYILVDEYQDTNSAQNLTVKLLGSFFETPNIFVVGDDDQSIYRFQGASVENIIEFHQQYQEELKIITLIKNYRSQQNVLDAAGALISNNQTRLASQIPGIDKTLTSQTPAPAAPLQLTIYETRDAENFGVAGSIQQLLTAGTPPTEIAVLYRNHRDSFDLIEILQKLQIPYQIIAGKDILEDLHIDHLIQLFRLIDQPNANDILSQVLFLNFFQFSRLDILKLTHYYFTNRLEKQGHSLFQILKSPQDLEKAGLEKPQLFQEFAEKILEWKTLSINETLSHFFEQVIKTSGYLENMLAQNNRLESLNRLNTLFREIKKQNTRNHALTISEFLEQLKMRSQNNLKLLENPLIGERNGIQLMTAHGSKGLEFEHVFLIHSTHSTWDKPGKTAPLELPAGLISHEITDEKLAFSEDQRRLFYVALTRAKTMVHLSYARFYSEQSKVREDLPTLFLQEIPPHLVQTLTKHNQADQDLSTLETLFLTSAEPDYSWEEKNYLTQLAKNFVMSPTALNNYLTCPRKFFYQNLIRLPQAKHPSAAMGTAIHAALEKYFKQYHLKKIKPPKEFLTLHFKTALAKELLTDKDYQDKLAIGLKTLNEYYDSYHETFSSETIAEFNFSDRDYPVQIENIKITGKIDKIEPSSKGLVVTDFKTGNPDSALSKLSHGQDYWRQLVFYKILCDHSTKFKRAFQSQQMNLARVEFLEKSRKTGTFIHRQIDITPADQQEVIENIKITHQQIQNLQFEKIDQSEPCTRCPFHGICWKS